MLLYNSLNVIDWKKQKVCVILNSHNIAGKQQGGIRDHGKKRNGNGRGIFPY